MGRKDCKRNAGRVCKACIGQRKEQGCAVQGVRDQPSHRGQMASAIPRRSAPVRSEPRASKTSWPRLTGDGGEHRSTAAAIPGAGAEKLRKIMENRGGENLPCARTFNNIFARNHLITKDASLAVTHIQRFEKEKPNDMWQTDFKGNFALANGVRCHPLNILDDRSRFCLCVEALENETFLAVKPVFERVFSEYGLPLACCATTGIHGAQHRARATLPLRCGLWSWASSPCMAALVIRRPKGNRSALTVLLPTSVWTEIRSWILRMLR